jgi:peptidoglycan/LPS O-acetylase OafA/YrhL
MNLAERVGSRQNNFNALRLIAAVMVLVSHCFALTNRPEPLATISQESFGELGVSIFFAISGFLIARSWHGDPGLPRFAAKRALRLMPGLIVAVLITALVLGPAVTSLSPSGYLGDANTYGYIARNSVLDTINGHLPGVFLHNLYPEAINGSLWTLPVEALAYVAAAVLGVVGALRGRILLPVLSFIVLLALSTPPLSITSIQTSGPVGGHLDLVLYLGALFNAGLLLYVLRDHVVLRWDIAALLLAAWIATANTDWMHPVALLALPYLVLVLAYRTPRWVGAITRPGDLSYGIYVYAFPAQQLASYVWGPSLTPGVMLALVAAPLYLIALASWHLVEAPALRLKPSADLRYRATPSAAASETMPSQVDSETSTPSVARSEAMIRSGSPGSRTVS